MEVFNSQFHVSETEPEMGSFKGLASVFGNLVDAFVPTIIELGSFSKTLAENGKRVKILWQHDQNEPIGVPVQMSERREGLEVIGRVSPTQRGKDAMVLLRDGVVEREAAEVRRASMVERVRGYAMPSPFEKTTVRAPGLFDRLLRSKPKENALVEIGNRLAAVGAISEISPDWIDALAMNYSVNLRKTFPRQLADLYRRYLTHCFTDQQLSETEISELRHLKSLLGLTDQEAAVLHNEVAGAIYKRKLDEVLADGKVSEQERTFLQMIETNLQLPPEFAKSIYVDAAKAMVEWYLKSAISDERLSPEEETQLGLLANNLGATVEYERGTRELLNKYRLFWLAENGELPTIQPGIALQRGEKCYLTRAGVDWCENRTVTKTIRYSGVSYKVKIAKGLYWRAGSISPQRVTTDVLAHIDSGWIALTNKRLIFVGQRKNVSLRLQKILNFRPYSDGVLIEKDAGKSPILKFTEAVDVFAAIFERALRDAQV